MDGNSQVPGGGLDAEAVEYELKLGELVLRAKGDPRRKLAAGSRVGVIVNGACAVIAR